MSRFLTRAGMLSSFASCVLLGVLVYARLTGYDLGLSDVTRGRATQSALFFVLMNVTLVLAASAVARGALSHGYSAASCARDVASACVLVTGSVFVLCYILDGQFGDLPEFVRFVVARSSRALAPALALVAFGLTRRWSPAHPPSDVAGRWVPACMCVVPALMLVAVLVYLSDKVWPWPEPMVKQLLIVMCGLIFPAFAFAIAAVSVKRSARVAAVAGLAGVSLFAALL